MSLIHKQEMAEKDLAAHRANAAQSRGPVTPEGKANSAAANLRHGFYSSLRQLWRLTNMLVKVRNGALT